MKKLKLLLIACGLLVTMIGSAQTLTYRITEPRIVKATTEKFEFKVQVKASVAGTYYYSGQVIFDFNDVALDPQAGANYWKAVKVGGFSGNNTLDAAKYATTLTVTGSVGAYKLNIALSSDVGVFGNGPNADDFYEIPTTWTTMLTVTGHILSGTVASGVAISHIADQQSYIDAPNSTVLYADGWDDASFANLYLGRIYSTTMGWSQIGNTVNGQFVDWTTAVKTSVADGAVTLPSGVSNMSALSILSPAVLTIPVDGQLTNTGTLAIETANGLVVTSTVAGTGSLITGAVSGAGSADIQRYMTGADKWHLVSAPVTNLTISAFAGANAMATNGGKTAIGYYDNTIPNWVTYTTAGLGAAGSFTTGNGYEIMPSAATSTVTFTGLPGYDATSVGVLATGDKWNCIGNPYPSQIFANFNAHNTDNFVTVNLAKFAAGFEAVYMWDAATTTYIPYNNASAATYVPSSQAFMVRATAADNMSFTTVMRNHGTAAFKSGDSRPSIKLNANIAGQNKSTWIAYINDATEGIDAGYDASVFDGQGSSTANLLATHIDGSDLNFAIQGLPAYGYESIEVPVVLNAPAASAITFTADVANFPGNIVVYLEDRAAGKFIRMDQEDSFYSIVVPSEAKGTGRFYIHATIANGIDNPIEDSYTIIPLPSENKIRVLGIVNPASRATIYSMNGSVLTTATLNNIGENEIPFRTLSTGVYILKIETGTTVIKKKINWVF